MIINLNSLYDAVAFTQNTKANVGELINRRTAIREAEFSRYVKAAQAVYPMWIYILNERPEKDLFIYACLVVDRVGYMIYRLQEIRTLNHSLPLLPHNEILFLLETLTEMYNSLIEITAPDAVQELYNVLLHNHS